MSWDMSPSALGLHSLAVESVAREMLPMISTEPNIWWEKESGVKYEMMKVCELLETRDRCERRLLGRRIIVSPPIIVPPLCHHRSSAQSLDNQRLIEMHGLAYMLHIISISYMLHIHIPLDPMICWFFRV